MNQELYTILKAIHKNENTTGNLCYEFYGSRIKSALFLCDECICFNCPLSSYNPSYYVTPLLLGFDNNVG